MPRRRGALSPGRGCVGGHVLQQPKKKPKSADWLHRGKQPTDWSSERKLWRRCWMIRSYMPPNQVSKPVLAVDNPGLPGSSASMRKESSVWKINRKRAVGTRTLLSVRLPRPAAGDAGRWSAMGPELTPAIPGTEDGRLYLEDLLPPCSNASRFASAGPRSGVCRHSPPYRCR